MRIYWEFGSGGGERRTARVRDALTGKGIPAESGAPLRRTPAGSSHREDALPLSPNDSARRIWEAALGRLQLQTPKTAFDTWLSETTGERVEGGALTVSAPTSFGVAWLERRMPQAAADAVSAAAGRPLKVAFELRGERAAPKPAPPAAANASEASGLAGGAAFSSFVQTPENRLAHAAALAAARSPGAAYNPLFIYGGVGLGKTHLLQAIGRHAAEAGLSVLYTTTEDLTSAYLKAMREKRTAAFRERFWSPDVFLLDDAHALAEKSLRVQEGTLHGLDALRRKGSQIVAASDRPALSLPIEERLRSRLAGGLQADLSAPGPESRLILLTAFADEADAVIGEDVLEFLAKRIPGDIQVIKGCLTRLLALADLTGQAITHDLARQAVGDQFSTDSPQVSPAAVIAAVARYRGLPPSALEGPRRDKAASGARQEAMRLLHTMLGLSAEEIGATLGGRDRATILYGLRRTAERLRQDADAANALDEIRASLAAEPLSQRLSTSA